MVFRTVALLLLFPFTGFGQKTKTPKSVDVKEETIMVGGESREYRLAIPQGLQDKVPLWFVFHGYRGQVKVWMHQHTDIDRLALEKKFIVVYPKGPISWKSRANESRDVAFFDTLYEVLVDRYEIDTSRVFGVGHSNGAAFVSLLAARRSDKLAAVAAHSGIVSSGSVTSSFLGPPCPVLVVLGSKDFLTPETPVLKEAVQSFESWGHSVEVIGLEGHGHSWGTKHNVNQTIVSFFEANPQREPTVSDKRRMLIGKLKNNSRIFWIAVLIFLILFLVYSIRARRASVSLVLLLLAFPFIGFGQKTKTPANVDVKEETIMVGGESREYRLTIPQGLLEPSKKVVTL